MERRASSELANRGRKGPAEDVLTGKSFSWNLLDGAGPLHPIPAMEQTLKLPMLALASIFVLALTYGFASARSGQSTFAPPSCQKASSGFPMGDR
jgi:hypothetical protein